MLCENSEFRELSQLFIIITIIIIAKSAKVGLMTAYNDIVQMFVCFLSLTTTGPFKWQPNLHLQWQLTLYFEGYFGSAHIIKRLVICYDYDSNSMVWQYHTNVLWGDKENSNSNKITLGTNLCVCFDSNYSKSHLIPHG